MTAPNVGKPCDSEGVCRDLRRAGLVLLCALVGLLVLDITEGAWARGGRHETVSFMAYALTAAVAALCGFTLLRPRRGPVSENPGAGAPVAQSVASAATDRQGVSDRARTLTEIRAHAQVAPDEVAAVLKSLLSE